MTAATARLLAPAMVAGAAILAAALPSAAQQFYADREALGPGACQAAMPGYEALLRKQPTALSNVSTANAFVTCSPHQVQWIDGRLMGVSVTIANRRAGAVAVTCTAVRQATTPRYFPRTVTVPAGTERELWLYTDDDYDPVAVSCMLPPDTSIARVASFGRYD